MVSADDLTRTLRQAIETGRLGTPVSLRVHLTAPESAPGLDELLAAAIEDFASLIGGISGTWQAMGPGNARQRSVLISNAAGRTLFLTAVRAAVSATSVRLLLTGNHGIANMSSAVDVDWSTSATAGRKKLAAWIDESARSSASVRVAV